MKLYKCECGNTRELSKSTIVYRNKKWVTKEAKCECGLYMECEPEEGMPTLKRTEASLSKGKEWDRLKKHLSE
jgi:hypothetical protein